MSNQNKNKPITHSHDDLSLKKPTLKRVSRTASQPPKRRKTDKHSVFDEKKRMVCLREGLSKMIPLMKSRDEKKKALALASSSYFADQKDLKSPPIAQLQKEIEIIENELKLIRSVVKAGIGNNPISIRLWVPFVITTTVTTGITNTVTIGTAGSAAIQPSFTSEWPSLVSLFDEYRMLGGTLHWLYMNPVSPTSLNASGASSIPAIGYDPSDGTVANAVNTVCQLAQHKILPAANDTWAGFKAEAKHEFHFTVPKGVMNDEAPTGSTSYGTQWIACDAASAIHGWIKHYHQGAVVTAVNTGAGQVVYDLQFRCRS